MDFCPHRNNGKEPSSSRSLPSTRSGMDVWFHFIEPSPWARGWIPSCAGMTANGGDDAPSRSSSRMWRSICGFRARCIKAVGGFLLPGQAEGRVRKNASPCTADLMHRQYK